MSVQRLLPILTSIAILIVVGLLRDRSRTAAALLATLPINLPLALWVIAEGSGNDTRTLTDAVRTMFIGLVPGLIWLGVVYLALRAGWGVLAAIVAGYAVWGLLIGGLFWLGILTLPR
jgi:hypothetical protein